MKPSFLVITLHSGENEFGACKASVAAQQGVDVSHEVIAGLDNEAAHKALYQMIMSNADSYDRFLKLDADMVLNRPTALQEVNRVFENNPGVDHVVSMVQDHYTNRAIYGVHSFSPRVRWELEKHDQLFVDPDPQYEGTMLRDPDGLAIYVDHAPDPDRYQAFHFGFHRTLKLMQMIKNKQSARHIQYQLGILKDAETYYEKDGPETLGMTVLAADLVRRGELTAKTGDKNNAQVEAAFRKIENLSDDQVRKRVRMGKPARMLAYWWLLLRIRRKVEREERQIARNR
ncbi:hypothetical protein [uncultured Roseobacter sp.]|uniref:hypothetical protein n=1 Tax=uncultured Roseobacter sp. TaxID=114847 RepID=UPI00263963C0|nr:hypothetical protein [uncultured Roseobacter sp.]